MCAPTQTGEKPPAKPKAAWICWNPPVLPGRKGMILCLGSFWPPSMGNLSSICIWKRKCKRGEESQGFTGRTRGQEGSRQNKPRGLQQLPPFLGGRGGRCKLSFGFPRAGKPEVSPRISAAPQGTELGLTVSAGALCLNNSAFMEALETTCPGIVLSPLQPCTRRSYTFSLGSQTLG